MGAHVSILHIYVLRKTLLSRVHFTRVLSKTFLYTLKYVYMYVLAFCINPFSCNERETAAKDLFISAESKRFFFSSKLERVCFQL